MLLLNLSSYRLILTRCTISFQLLESKTPGFYAVKSISAQTFLQTRSERFGCRIIFLWHLVNYLQLTHLTLRAGARKPSCFYRCPCLWFHTCMYVSHSCEDGIIHTPCYASKTCRSDNVDVFTMQACTTTLYSAIK